MKAASLANSSSIFPKVSFNRGESAKAARKKDVFDIIEKNFDSFDLNGDSKITWSEIRKNVANPAIKGENAAALATLYSLVTEYAGEEGLIRTPSVTASLVEELKSNRDFELEEGDIVSADAYYNKYLDKLENTSSSLFARKLPDGLKVRQGVDPSCAILSTTVAQAVANPELIKNSLTQLENGKVAVKFPGLDKPIVTPATTDTENALFASAGKDGTWLNQIVKAWGTHEGKNPLAAFEQDSWPADSIKAWSSGQAVTESLPRSLDKESPAKTPEFIAKMSEQLAQKHIVMSWTRSGERELNLIAGHAHTVLAIDQDKQTITLRNPWGHKEPENAKGKPRDGKDDGIFKLSYQEYAQNFEKYAMQVTD